MTEKNIKVAKCEHALKVLKVKGSFNPELQLKDTKPAIRNKLKNIVELRGFKFVTTLVLVFKR